MLRRSRAAVLLFSLLLLGDGLLVAVTDEVDVGGWTDKDNEDEGVDEVDLEGDASVTEETLTLRFISLVDGFLSV